MATASTEDIQRIVREVMAQLELGSKSAVASVVELQEPPAALRPPSAGLTLTPRFCGAAVPAARAGETPAPQVVFGQPSSASDLFVDSRVVTLELIAGRLTGTKQLMVLPGALVTPAVRDELRRKGVLLVRGSTVATVRKELLGVLLVVGLSRHDPTAAVQTLTQLGIRIQTETLDCMIASTDKLAAAVASGQSLGLLWTRHTAVGLCLANRHAGVRAVLATNVSATAAAVSAVGANLLVVDPTVGTAYEKKQILRDFCLGGIRQCPEALKERLGR